MKINITALRKYLQDYYGSAIFSGFPNALADEENAENLSSEALCQLAIREGIDLTDFEIDGKALP